EYVGLNNRMTDIHASIGRVQLTKLAGWTKTRQENAAFLSSNITEAITPAVPEGYVHVYHQYTIRLEGATGEERDRFVTALKEEHQV
ncbi:DegT/DnrJ/EryC1/StrS family aminotransferase, partial [Klebsiella pneumoniae]